MGADRAATSPRQESISIKQDFSKKLPCSIIVHLRPEIFAMDVKNNILETIGNTPLVRLNKITKDLPCEIYAKVESKQ